MIKFNKVFIWASVASLVGSMAQFARADTLPVLQPGSQNQLQGVVNPGDLLKPGDRVQITIAGFPDLSGQHLITTDGTVQLPLAGIIEIGGLTPFDAVAPLTEAMRPYVRRPQVSLAVLSLSPIRISVTGEVRQPGPRLLAPFDAARDEEQLPPTLSQALVQAGGVTPEADLQNIVIRRGSAPNTEVQVDLWQAIQTGDLQVDTRIYDGDEIVVPTATQIGDIEQRTLLSSTVAPEQIVVQVAGEVNDPGQIQLRPFSGVNGAVAAAGGLTDGANPELITLLRLDPNGSVQQQTFAFGDASGPLIDGDVIYVAESTRDSIGDVFDFLGRILNPFGGLFRFID